MKIYIAGAGAGKTTSMADKIIKFRSNMEEHLKIFCIAFTNNAVKCVSEKLQAHYGCLPDNIIVSTIHSFLYQEFIRPYYYLLFNKHYQKIEISDLLGGYMEINNVIKKYEYQNILHQTVIPERAKWVVVKKSTDKKITKEKRTVINDTFKSYCGAICIDEAQDIDENMLEIIELLDKVGIEILLMGDPKQDLKGHKCLRKLIEKYPEAVEYFNLCHRCPQKHLDLSNTIVTDEETQYSQKNSGLIMVCFASEKKIDELIAEKNFDLKYISRKQDVYETHLERKNKDVREKLSKEIYSLLYLNNSDNSELYFKKYSYYLAEKLLSNYVVYKDRKIAIDNTFKEEISNDKKTKIFNLIPEITENKENKDIVYVNSIDSIKGQEGNNCLFILTTDLAAYLFGDKTKANTTKNKLYVGLTRSSDKLTIFITQKVEQKYGKEKIKSFFKEYECM